MPSQGVTVYLLYFLSRVRVMFLTMKRIYSQGRSHALLLVSADTDDFSCNQCKYTVSIMLKAIVSNANDLDARSQLASPLSIRV